MFTFLLFFDGLHADLLAAFVHDALGVHLWRLGVEADSPALVARRR